MNFKDIIDKLGEGEVRKTWLLSEDNIAYKVDFKMDGMIFSFVSYDEVGTYSQLYIYLDNVQR